MEEKIFENFLNNIISIEIDGKLIDLKTSKLEIKLYENTTKQLIAQYKNRLNLYINGVKVQSNFKFKIVYKCLSCNSLNEILSYKRFLTKINGNYPQFCVHCIQKFDPMNMKQFRHTCLIGKKKGTFKFAKEKIKKEIKFEDLSEIQKNEYWMNHYSIDEWKDFIKRFNVEKINEFNVNDVEYIPIHKCSNQKMFSSVIKINDKVYSIKTVWCRCKECDSLYKIHWKKLDTDKKVTSQICKECGKHFYLANRTWPIRSCFNINNDKILYQSSYEKEFIDWCNENEILIQNGPTLNYFWNDKNRTYKVDFFIPKLNKIIELKDFHKYHLEEVKSGQWTAKEGIAREFVEKGFFNEYILLFKKDFNSEWKQNFLSLYNDDIV